MLGGIHPATPLWGHTVNQVLRTIGEKTTGQAHLRPSGLGKEEELLLHHHETTGGLRMVPVMATTKGVNDRGGRRTGEAVVANCPGIVAQDVETIVETGTTTMIVIVTPLHGMIATAEITPTACTATRARILVAVAAVTELVAERVILLLVTGGTTTIVLPLGKGVTSVVASVIVSREGSGDANVPSVTIDTVVGAATLRAGLTTKTVSTTMMSTGATK